MEFILHMVEFETEGDDVCDVVCWLHWEMPDLAAKGWFWCHVQLLLFVCTTLPCYGQDLSLVKAVSP